MAVEALMQHDLAIRARGLRPTNTSWWAAYDVAFINAPDSISGEGVRIILERYKRRAQELDVIIRNKLSHHNETGSFQGSRGATQAEVDYAAARTDLLFVHAALGANVRSNAQCGQRCGTLPIVLDRGSISILETVLCTMRHTRLAMRCRWSPTTRLARITYLSLQALVTPAMLHLML